MNPTVAVRPTLPFLLLFLPASAAAYEDQLAVGLDLGYAQVFDGGAGAGVAGGPHAKMGLDDTWNLYAAGMYGYHPDPDSALHAAHFAAGIEYVFDVLQWIPYGGVGAEVLYGASGDDRNAAGGFQVSVGLDYLATRDHSFGITVRWHTLLSDLDRFPAYLTLALRGSLLWDL